MDKLPFKYKLLQFVADNYVFILFLGYMAGIATGVALQTYLVVAKF